VSERSLQPGWHGSLRRSGQHFRLPLPRRLHRRFLRDQYRRLRVRSMPEWSDVPRRGWQLQMHLPGGMGRLVLSDGCRHVSESTMPKRRHLRGSVSRLLLRVSVSTSFFAYDEFGDLHESFVFQLSIWYRWQTMRNRTGTLHWKSMHASWSLSGLWLGLELHLSR